MATCEELRQFFDTPLQDMIKTPSLFDSLSSWKQLKSINNPIDQPSFTEIFGELHFHEKTEETPVLSPDLKKLHPLDPPPGVPKNQQNFDSLQLCTEGLGFESLADAEEEDDDSIEHLGGACSINESRPETGYSRSLSGKAGKGYRSFPPPISTLGRSGKPLVYFKSYRDDGRFILREIRIPTHEFLHASRQDGRLKLQFVVHPNENNFVINGGARRGGEEGDDDDDDEHEEMVSG